MRGSKLILAAGILAALGMMACGDDSSGGGGSGGVPAQDCASCTPELVQACEQAVEICISGGVAVQTCIQAAVAACQG